MKTLKILFTQIRYKIVYIAIFLSIVILSINNPIYLLVVFSFALWLYKWHRQILVPVAIIVIIYLLSYFIVSNQQLPTSTTHEALVLESSTNETYTSGIMKIEGIKVKFYYSNVMKLEPGEKYLITGDMVPLENNTVPGNFNYKGYLSSKRIRAKTNINKIEFVEKSFHINQISYKAKEHIETSLPKSKGYVKTFLLADKSDIDQDIRDNVSSLGISHLFAVSGMHVSLIVLVVIYILNKTNLNDLMVKGIVIFILLSFAILTSLSPSVLRAVFMYILLLLNKKLEWKLSSIDILSIIFIGLLLVNPNIYQNIGFVLSFLVTLGILLSKNILHNRGKVMQLFLISLIAMMITLPITANMNYNVNLLGLFANIIFVYLVTFIIMPLSYIVIIIPAFDVVFSYVISMFEALIRSFSNIDIFKIELSFSSTFSIMFYYVVLYFLISNFTKFKNTIYPVSLYISLILFFSMIMPYKILKSVSFIDVHGDSILIQDSFDRCNILIDTGDVDDYDSVINYLKYNHVKRIDYFILTHDHRDHNGEQIDIENSFDINYVITSETVNNLASLEHQCGSIDLRFLTTSYYSNENNNSVVLLLEVSGKRFLFTGDIEVDRENELLAYPFENVDYLKIPHHGSYTSSSAEFLSHVNPDSAIVIASRSNKFGHPNKGVMDRYREHGITVYRTDEMGTIKFSYIFGKEFQSYHQP